jgi:type I restriction enzyme, S subunit
VDAKAFLAEFGHIASAPGGVSQLREMIRAVAVRGELLPTHVAGDAERDLESIRERKRLHPEQRKVVKPQQPPDARAVAAPPHWARCRLGDLVLTITGGGTPSKSNPRYWGGDIPWASVKDLTGGKFLESTEDHITAEGLRDSASNLIAPGRVVICTRMGLGKIAVTKFSTAINQDLKAFELPPEIDTDFFFLLYQTTDISGTGTTVAGITQEKLLGLAVAVPSLLEQTLIVAKVDELMSLCDKLEDLQKQLEELRTRTLDRNLSAVNAAPVTDHAELSKAWRRVDAHMGILCRRPADVKALRASVLRLASRGALSFANEGESSVTFLASMSQTRKRDLRKVGRRVADATAVVVNHPHDIPPRWVWTRLDGVADISSGSTPLKSRDDFYAGGTVPWVTSTHTTLRYVDSVPDFVTDVAVKECRLTLYPVGTLLMAMYGQGKTRGQVTELRVPATTNQACAAIVLRHESEVFRKFVRIVLDDRYHELRALADGGAQPNLNGQKVKATAVPIPPLEEQARIVNAVEKLCGVLDELERMLVQKEQLSQALAINCVAAITGIRAKEYTPMKTPKTELISNLRLSATPPAAHDAAPLAALLARHANGIAAKSLWGASGLDIDAFYRQLKVEMAQGWIVQPEVATVREVATR